MSAEVEARVKEHLGVKAPGGDAAGGSGDEETAASEE
jgi:hypothetical protein